MDDRQTHREIWSLFRQELKSLGYNPDSGNSLQLIKSQFDPRRRYERSCVTLSIESLEIIKALGRWIPAEIANECDKSLGTVAYWHKQQAPLIEHYVGCSLAEMDQKGLAVSHHSADEHLQRLIRGCNRASLSTGRPGWRSCWRPTARRSSRRSSKWSLRRSLRRSSTSEPARIWADNAASFNMTYIKCLVH